MECGFIKSLVLICVVSLDMLEELVLYVLSDCGMYFLEEIIFFIILMVEKIFVNGCWVGIFYDYNVIFVIVVILR